MRGATYNATTKQGPIKSTAHSPCLCYYCQVSILMTKHASQQHFVNEDTIDDDDRECEGNE